MKYFYLICVLFACNESYQNRIIKPTNDHQVDFFIDANRLIIKHEEQYIDSLLRQSTLNFTKDSIGIRLIIDKNNQHDSNIFPQNGDVVTIAYDCVLFDKYNLLEQNEIVDTISFQIGYSKQMRGLNYAIKLLEVGDKAKIIIPSYLGFGMSGYGKEVPPYSTLLLNVNLLNIKK